MMKLCRKKYWLCLLLSTILLFSACGEQGSVVTTTTAPIRTTTVAATTTAQTTTTTAETKATKIITTQVPTTTTTEKVSAATAATATVTSVVAPVTVTTTTASSVKTYRGTTPIPTRPGYTYPVIPDTFTEELLRTDVTLALDKTCYYGNEGVNICIANTTDREICVDPARAVLRKDSNGEWEYVYQQVYKKEAPEYLDKGETYAPRSLSLCHTGWYDGLADQILPTGDYKLIWAVDGGWIGTDFTIAPKPDVSLTIENVRTDVALEFDKTVLGEATQVSIQNTTDHDIVVHEVFTILKKDGENWRWIREYAYCQPITLKPGDCFNYEKEIYLSTKTVSDFQKGETGKLAWLVDDKWVTIDFTVE